MTARSVLRSLLVALWLLSSPVAAQNGSAGSVQIVNFGVYSLTRVGKVENGRTANGFATLASDYKLIEQTDRICAKLQVSFGVEFRVEGAPAGASVMLDWVTRFPPEGMVNGRGERFLANETRWSAVLGGSSFRTFTFDEPWEIVTGTWTLEFYFEGRKIGQQSFNVLRCGAIS